MKVSCLNPISKLGLGLFDDKYEVGAEYAESELVLVRSAAMHDLSCPRASWPWPVPAPV